MRNGKPRIANASIEELIEAAAETTPLATRDVDSQPIPEGHTQVDLFQRKEIRKICHSDEWWYSIVDIVGALSHSSDPGRYWPELKANIAKESNNFEFLGRIEKLKIPGKDGKMYPTDCGNAETILRIVQSIPSPHAEPFKKWLARTAYERILEFQNPEIFIKRAIAAYRSHGRDEEWIRNRLQTVVSRNQLTSEWQRRGVSEGVEYALLTDTISLGTFQKTTAQHREYKSLEKRHSLRDHMTVLELVNDAG